MGFDLIIFCYLFYGFNRRRSADDIYLITRPQRIFYYFREDTKGQHYRSIPTPYFAAQGANRGAVRELTKTRYSRLCISRKVFIACLVDKNLNCRVTNPVSQLIFGAILVGLPCYQSIAYFAAQGVNAGGRARIIEKFGHVVVFFTMY